MNNGVGTNQWLNQEQQAVFDNTGSNRAITVNGTVIAHGLTFNSGATGYSFSGGSLTITAGGIQANESVTFNSDVYIGGPQSWNVAAGKSLTVTGPLHTIISNLTFSGAGTTAISGGIDGGGVINLQGGAKPGGLIQAGTGAVTITNVSSFAGDITAQAGAGTLYIVAPGGGAATFNGTYFGGGTINFNCSSLTLGGGGSNFSGTMAWQQPTIVTFVPGAGLAGTFSNVFSTNVSWIWQDGPGTTVLSGTNGYNGTTLVSNGALQADSGVGLPTASCARPRRWRAAEQCYDNLHPYSEQFDGQQPLRLYGQWRRFLRRQQPHDRQHRRQQSDPELGNGRRQRHYGDAQIRLHHRQQRDHVPERHQLKRRGPHDQCR